MLVSTHNLGSVPEFCDQVVLVNRTVLAAGPTAEVFTEQNLERAFGGVLRHFRLEQASIRMTTAGRYRADRRRAARRVRKTATRIQRPRGARGAVKERAENHD